MAAIQFYGREIKKPRLPAWVFCCPSLVSSFDYSNGTLQKRSAVYMRRKKKLVNNTTIPQYAVERFARCVFDDIRTAYADQEVQAEFALWLAEREQNKKTRAAKTAALVSIMGNKQIIRTRFRFGRYGSDYFALVRGKGLEPSRINHTHLKRTCLPVPPSSHIKKYLIVDLVCL